MTTNTTIYDELLPIWDHPTGFDSDANFAGYKPQGYVIYSQNRDSSLLETTNFTEILKDLGGESEFVEVIRHGHWGCGWIEYLVVSKESPTHLLDRCVDIVRGLENYPVYSEDRYSEVQHEAICDYWKNMILRDRVQYCGESGISMFAARREEVPSEVYDQLRSDIY